ncbi:MAG: diguanylate cyclase [Roseburia sp.]|nr:diguanylate cyclase [Ruminococcus sp.]MCM1155325.1 diguanylate cyclase [Roseburia sp.]MCM1243006.1 diguanylate cyclase [Roseburia sp.]
MAIEEMNVENFGSMINNIIAGICFFEYENDEITPIFVNDGFFRMLGYSRPNGMQYLKNVRMSIIPDDIPIFEQAIKDVLKDDGSVEVEFRTVTASGGLRWLQVRGNLYAREGSRYIIVCIIQDITEKKNVEEELHQQAERLHILMEVEGEKIIDYNAKTDVLVIRTSGDYASTGEVIINRYMQQYENDTIYGEDKESYQKIWNALLKSPGHETIEVRTKKFDNDYTWYQMNLTSLLGAEGYVTRVVGRLINIHEKKLEEINVQLRSKRDALTRLHEKDAAMQLIQNMLAEDSNSDILSALFIIDMDNFKKVNDLLGQAQCDNILVETGIYLSKIIKGIDVVGRIDVDRFAVYVRNIPTFSDADRLAASIVDKINYKLPYGNENILVTCSIGIAIVPYHGITWDELYEKANRALTRVKARGKYGYRIYDAAVTLAYHSLRRHNNIAYDAEKGMELDWNIEDMVMQVLYEDKVLETALQSAIELITVHYKFHRGFICGSERGTLPLSKQVQFSVHGYEMGQESKEHYDFRSVVYEVLYDSFKNCSIIHEYDITVEELRYYFQSEGIKSMLYYPITSKGEFQGAIIFENHEDVQLEFENNIMEELRSLFRVLEAHVLQIGLMDRLQDFATQISMMDNMDSYVYIINADTYELSFVNKKVLMQAPDVKIGDTCYKAIQHRDTPCENCIFSQMKREPHERHTEEMFNYSLRCWCRNSISWLECKEGNALGLLNCIDISEYFIG